MAVAALLHPEVGQSKLASVPFGPEKVRPALVQRHNRVVRNIRRDEVEHLRRVEREGHVSKDEVETKLAEIQRVTDQFVSRVDEAVQKKDKDAALAAHKKIGTACKSCHDAHKAD